MAAVCELESAGIIEKDGKGAMWVWSYPAVSEQQRKVIMRKTPLTSDEKSDSQPSFLYGQFQHLWYYIMTVYVNGIPSSPKVSGFSIVLIAKDFSPEKYSHLGRILCQAYGRRGNAVTVLQSYLAVFTRGHCNGEDNGAFNLKDYDAQQAYASGSLKSVVQRFGVESIIIYTAMMLKKKIAVFNPSPEELLSFTRALPAFVWHRQNWSILYPFIHLEDDELREVQESFACVFGTCEASIQNRNDLYDVFVNLQTNEIIVSPQAKESMALGKLHKDIALFMVEAAEDDDKTELEMIKDVAGKTKELLNNLRSLAVEGSGGKPVITLEGLRAKKMAPNTENFLFGLAAAENLLDS